ncbi:MAG TPA: hypothetical protein VJA21_00360 [Verrucomicrobiae bacterium]
MSTTTEQEVATSVAKPSRVAKIIRWAARLTSIPIFALLLVSLVPALENFAVSARDDRIIAVGLCGTAVGFLAGWRWAGIGGLMTLGSVVLILSQEEGGLSADPFSVAFGLQGILFLASSVLNAPKARTEAAAIRNSWITRIAAGGLTCLAVLGAAIILRGPGPTPLPKEQEPYVGVWDNGAGFKLEITSDGRVKVSQAKDAKVDACNTPVRPGESAEFLVEFRDDRLQLGRGTLGETKTYHIDRPPFSRSKRITMVLNGSDPYYRTNGMLLVKTPPADAKSEKPPGRPGQS